MFILFSKSLFSAMRIFEEFDSTFMMWLFMLMPFIEEVVRSSLLQDEYSMLPSWLLSQDSWNQFISLRSNVQRLSLEESMEFSIEEEVTSSKKIKSWELPCSWSRLIFLSMSPSASLLTCDRILEVKLSLSVSSITGKSFQEIPWTASLDHGK